jgi:hypothetical protein
MPIISGLLKLVQRLINNGVSSDAPTASMPDGQTTQNSTAITCLVEIKWTKQTNDGLIGQIWTDGILVCDAITNLNDRILDGVYMAKIDLSPRLGYRCPHMAVPERDSLAGGDAGLRIHKANTPSQSLGCIFPGTSIDGDAVDDSTDAFNHLMSILPQSEPFQLSISSSIAA